MANVRDRWTAGATYEDFMGRWSRQVAPRFVRWLGVPAGQHWLDVGCGTGALTSAICDHGNPASVVGCDPAEAFIEFARSSSADRRASFVVAAAGSLPRRGGGYGCVTSSFALNFIPDPETAVGEMRSLAVRGGIVSACVWDYAAGMQFLRLFWDAVAATDPLSAHLDEALRFPLCHPDKLAALFGDAGLRNVVCEGINILTEFPAFDDYWRPMLGGTGPAPSYVASLDEAARTRLMEMVEQLLPSRSDGSIPLTARAWAVRGNVS